MIAGLEEEFGITIYCRVTGFKFPRVNGHLNIIDNEGTCSVNNGKVELYARGNGQPYRHSDICVLMESKLDFDLSAGI